MPKQIQFSPGARVLVVDEAGSDTFDTFVVGRDGRVGPALTMPSTGGGPFGFDFDRAGYLLVSDAVLSTGQSGATSYDIARDGAVTANGPAVPIGQAAACWLAAQAVSRSRQRGQRLDRPLRRRDRRRAHRPRQHAGRERPDRKAADEGVSAGQNYLYVLAGSLAQIVGYRVGADGSLTQVTTAPVAAGSAGIGAS